MFNIEYVTTALHKDSSSKYNGMNENLPPQQNTRLESRHVISSYTVHPPFPTYLHFLGSGRRVRGVLVNVRTLRRVWHSRQRINTTTSAYDTVFIHTHLICLLHHPMLFFWDQCILSLQNSSIVIQGTECLFSKYCMICQPSPPPLTPPPPQPCIPIPLKKQPT